MSKRKPKISVIIPIYNVEKYLRRLMREMRVCVLQTAILFYF